MYKKEIIQLFLGYVRTALESEIQPVYFGLTYWSETDKAPIEDEAKKYLRRYHERVFCYELYYHLRFQIEMDEYFFRDIFLQSEVIKSKLPVTVWRGSQVKKLSKNFMPDFLLHTPGNFENQLIVMEVKSSPAIKRAHVKNDINKIAEFMERYGYLCGVFLAVNTTVSNIWEMLYSQKETFATMPDEHKKGILIMVQDMPSRTFAEFSLYDIFTN
jgi:hypothetical protein